MVEVDLCLVLTGYEPRRHDIIITPTLLDHVLSARHIEMISHRLPHLNESASGCPLILGR
jgi:hypothetical protein